MTSEAEQPEVAQPPQGQPQGQPQMPQLPMSQLQAPPMMGGAAPGPQVAKADARQLTFSPNEMGRLANKIQQDFFNAESDHDRRIERFKRYYRRWRGLTEPTYMGEEEASNYGVPLTQWQVYSKWAKQNGSLFGDDAEITAKPIGPDDQRRVKKVARFMTWRMFDSMRIQNPATIFNFRQILFGRSHAWAPWARETYMVPMDDGTEQETVSYDGPKFEPCWPDDFVVPAEDVTCLHEFSFVIRKTRMTPDDLLRGEDKEQFQGIKENFERLYNFSNDRRKRDAYAERIKLEKDAAEGVSYEGNLSGANCLIVYEWYGKWRMLKGKKDAAETNLSGRELYETELLIKYLPDLHMIVGIQKLGDMYPTKKNRRPFVEAGLVEDGSYWGPGFGEMLENIELEMSVNHNLMTEAGQFSVGPIIFYKPGTGFDPSTFKYEPNTCVATDDPGAVRVISTPATLQYPMAKEQLMVSYAERVTGITDMNIGRGSDRPNAPRTARGTLALLEEGDVRATLDLGVLREYWGKVLTHYWELEQMYGSPQQFFRVTEEDAGGLFKVSQGGSTMTEEERSGSYDFDLKFATSAYSKEQNKQGQLALYQIDLQNPLVVNNPKALWLTLDKIHRAFGDDRFTDVIPQPPDLGIPVDPKEEWVRCLEGDEIYVHPMDNDEMHILDHNKRLADEAIAPSPDRDAYNRMVTHVQDHIHQMQQKKMMAAMASALAQKMQQAAAPGFTQLSQFHAAAEAAQASQLQQQGAASLDGGGENVDSGTSGQGANESQPS